MAAFEGVVFGKIERVALIFLTLFFVSACVTMPSAPNAPGLRKLVAAMDSISVGESNEDVSKTLGKCPSISTSVDASGETQVWTYTLGVLAETWLNGNELDALITQGGGRNLADAYRIVCITIIFHNGKVMSIQK